MGWINEFLKALAKYSIKETCKLLKQELWDNSYEYGFYLNGKTYKPYMTKDFDKKFLDHLLTEYCFQDPKDTMKAKVGTCNDAVVLMRYILDKRNIPSKIWLLHDKQSGKQHTVLTFYLENKTVYLELTPQSGKPWYGKELIFDNERSFVDEYSKGGIEVIDVTDSVLIGERPNFLLSRMV